MEYTVKYQNYIIKKVPEDLDESNKKLNFVYYIYDKDRNYIDVALTLSMAKGLIDSNFDDAWKV